MMADTMKFKDLVFLIHPDRNPDLPDAGEKMKYARMYRKEENILYRLAVEWGVIKKEVPEPPKAPTPPPIRRRIVPAPRTVTPKPEPRPTPTQAWNTSETYEERQERLLNVKVDYFKFRVRNRIFQIGDTVYIRTKKATVEVVGVTNKRIYFMWEGKKTFALKTSVRFVRQ